MEKKTGTIFKVYLLDKTKAPKEEGFIQLWKHKDKLQKVKNRPSKRLSEIPKMMQEDLASAGIKWPKQLK